MKWSKVNSHCIRSGDYQIARYTIMGEDQFCLRYRGDLIVTKATAAKAKQSADQHEKQQGSAQR